MADPRVIQTGKLKRTRPNPFAPPPTYAKHVEEGGALWGIPVVLDPSMPFGQFRIESTPAPKWVTIRCPECGKVLCEATPGSQVRKVCDRCKAERVIVVAG